MTLVRPDLAELALQGVLEAESYRPVVAMQCLVASAPVRAGTDVAAEMLDQLVFGEVFDVLDIAQGWAWGRSRRDGVVGHVRTEALTADFIEPTHRVASVDAPVLETPGETPVVHLPLNALVAVQEVRGGFGRIARLGWMAMADLADFHAFAAEPAAVAEQFVGAPFLMGGRDKAGLDAAALVQQALYACGLGCPRAVDQQEALGNAASVGTLMRGDLIFWPGHVAMMLDSERLIHAEPETGVAVEVFAQAVARRASPQACRRL